MNGFKDDIISILRSNVMLHAEASGWIIQQHILPKTSELLKDLQDRKFAVIGRHKKPMFLFDYVIISIEHLTVNWLLSAFGTLKDNGLIILEVTDHSLAFANRYVSNFGFFTATKVTYGDNKYIVIRKGLDYGD